MVQVPNLPLEGDLKTLPLYALMRRIQHARGSGTLRVSRGSEKRTLWFDKGELRGARSSKLEHTIGASLVQWGYVSAEDLDRALEIQRRDGGRRLGAVLVELGLVPRSVIDAEARRLMEQIVSSALSWPEAGYVFEPRASAQKGEDIARDLSVTAMIVEGIRRVPESEKFLELLGDLSRVPRPAAPGGQFELVKLPDEASAILSLVDGHRDVRALLDLAPGTRLAAAKILFTMVYCGFLELHAVERKEPSSLPAAASRASRGARSERDHRSLVMTTWRRIDWLSDYDFLGVSTHATVPEIEDAYRRVSVLFDPALRDRADLSDCGRQLTVLSQRAREAYETLADSARRAAYDAQIQAADGLMFPSPDSPGEPVASPTANALSKEDRNSTASSCYARAVQLIAEGDVFPAIEMLEEAVRLVPDVAKYRFLLGRSKMRNRWWREEALEHLAEAGRLEPRSPEIQAALAEAYLEQGDPSRALPYARTALNVAPAELKEPYRILERRVESVLAV
jgi:hypothetical protein